ncbi:DNA topoisomerase IB [Nocardioides bruguierae]|uniref:DNA topoisomerase IB n=1 Tax=Nocardioides bruguierae TaxID=2945102 RepID=UPI002021A56C|nr:DNA topoisomerase IB [Nocardioides bruguierae]MCL8024603.1 DNA topoisomerase IB [Nocardioides bruguierae]
MRLRRTSPDQPGWTRRRSGKGWTYLDADGRRLSGEARDRCEALVIPPAWAEVWITPHAHGHLQAVGTDAAGRRQYLYHPEWRRKRDEEKFERVLTFGAALASARTRVLTDLGGTGMPLERSCAAAVRLLDLGCFRIGNDVYADAHGSFGLTTLERRHVRRKGEGLEFHFVGKSGVEHRIVIDDAGVIEALGVMRRRRAAEDPRLLAYTERRRWHGLLPDLVNTYVRETTGLHASAKDFRTWHATVLAASRLADAAGNGEPGATAASRKRAVSAAMKDVSGFLGNTPTLARTSYVDPRVVHAYEEGRTILTTADLEHLTPDDRQAALEKATLELLGGPEQLALAS